MLTVDFARLDARPGMTALDVGCGQGRHSLEFFRRGCTVVGVDMNPADLMHTRFLLTDLAREEARARGLPPSEDPMHPPEAGAPRLILRGDALRLPFPDGAFQRVVCSEVLEHVTDPDAAAAELVRVLAPGGRLAVSVPTPFTEWAFGFASDDYFNTPGGHVRVFTPGRARRLLRRRGLRVDDVHWAHAFHSLYWWVRAVFGLHDERQFMIRHFKKVLTHAMFSPMLARTERVFDHIFPKSMVFYARKDAPSRSLAPAAADGA